MHELGILYHVVKQVMKVADENRLTEVEAVVLQVGELSPVIPRYLHACYPAAVDGTLLEKARLEVEILPANAVCLHCGKVFAVLKNDGICPHCGDSRHDVISGKEFYIKEIRAR